MPGNVRGTSGGEMDEAGTTEGLGQPRVGAAGYEARHEGEVAQDLALQITLGVRGDDAGKGRTSHRSPSNPCTAHPPTRAPFGSADVAAVAS